jgi:hypothetical protein
MLTRAFKLEELQYENLNNHKKILAAISALILFLSFSITSVFSPSANAWSGAQTTVSVFGGSSFDFGNSIAVDSGGNIFTTGPFEGTVDFDPGAGVTNLTSAGAYDVFVSKLDSTGALLWAKSFGGSSSDIGQSIAVDTSGNVYTTGDFQGTVDFDPGAGVTNLTSAGASDVFVSKLDSTGSLLWVKSFSGSSFDLGRSIAVDTSGNVYTTGHFLGTADFDPGVGVTNRTSTGGDDVFVSKLDSTGSLLWVKSFGGASSDTGYSIAVDTSGNVYTTGYFQGTVDFDPGAGVTNLTSAGVSDVFVSKLDSTGSLLWVKSFGGASSDTGYSIAVDTSGNVYTTGYFQGTVDFDPGAGTTNLTSAGAYDVFVSKLDSTGSLLWVKSFGGASSDTGYSITFDRSGNIFTTGSFEGTVDFDYDVFVSKLDSTGSLLWVKSFGGASSGTGYSIAVDTSGNVYTTGYFEGTVDFDPGAGVTNLTSAGGADVFVLKLFPSGEVRDVAAANAEAARVAAAAAEAAKKAKEQQELREILALIPSIGELTLSLGETTKSLYSTKCVKGKTTKYVKYGAKCPKGYVKKK